MGKESEESKRLKAEIQDIREKMDWSYPYLGDIFGISGETIKKQLTTSKNQEGLLRSRLQALSQRPDVRQMGIIIPFYIKNEELEPKFIEQMAEISEKITQQLKNEQR